MPGAGKRGHITLDEFALHPDQRLLYRVAKPCTTWGGQLSIISTHRGTGTLFYQLIQSIKQSQTTLSGTSSETLSETSSSFVEPCFEFKL